MKKISYIARDTEINRFNPTLLSNTTPKLLTRKETAEFSSIFYTYMNS